MTDSSTVIEKLKSVRDPELHQDIVSLNMVRDVSVEAGKLNLSLILTTPACPLRETIENDVNEALKEFDDISEISIDWGADVRSTNRPDGPEPIKGVRNVIAVASNKGGVGKSTVAVNLALALSRAGARTGILDADITGPNLPTMLGIDEGLQSTGESGLRPVDSHGLKVVSLGFVLPAGTPVVWRGPMIGSGVRQLLHDVDWGELDYLIVDLPPGTSDASMSMAQDALIAGAVIVSTPSKVAVEDAQQAVGMFDRLGVPVFGVIENMRGEIFGSGGAEAAADDLGLEFLGHIPLAAKIREAGDNGDPLDNDDLEIEELFSGIAEQVAARCSVLQFAGEGATI